MLKRFIVALGLTLTLALTASISHVPATAEVQAASVTQQAEVKRVIDCGVAVSGATYLRTWNSFNCDVPSFMFSMAPAGWGWYCFNMTEWGTPPNGWSNQLSSVENESTLAVGFYDSFDCVGDVLFAVNAGTQRTSLVPAANNKASSFRVDNNGTWPPQ